MYTYKGLVTRAMYVCSGNTEMPDLLYVGYSLQV
jgi:hypothetical protein